MENMRILPSSVISSKITQSSPAWVSRQCPSSLISSTVLGAAGRWRRLSLWIVHFKDASFGIAPCAAAGVFAATSLFIISDVLPELTPIL